MDRGKIKLALDVQTRFHHLLQRMSDQNGSKRYTFIYFCIVYLFVCIYSVQIDTFQCSLY